MTSLAPAPSQDYRRCKVIIPFESNELIPLLSETRTKRKRNKEREKPEVNGFTVDNDGSVTVGVLGCVTETEWAHSTLKMARPWHM